MVNLLLTNYCNRSCPYCFAKQKVSLEKKGGLEKEQISVENAKKVAEFFKDVRQIGLLGGFTKAPSSLIKEKSDDSELVYSTDFIEINWKNPEIKISHEQVKNCLMPYYECKRLGRSKVKA